MSAEEVEVVNSIWENCLEEWSQGIWVVNIPEWPVSVRMSFPADYPDKPPKVLTVNGLDTTYTEKFQQIIDDNFIEGEVFVYMFVDEAKTMLDSNPPQTQAHDEKTNTASNQSQYIDDWFVSDEVKDRKSVFIGRALEVHSEAQALDKIRDLTMDKKIGKATHNIGAWRIVDKQGNLIQNCDDDGESAAGSRVLHLLDITKCTNVVVVVSRWYGGIQLGPDRFKHINACARGALVRGGFITSNS